MKLEQICVSQTLAKKLKKVGYPQDDSLFVWVIDNVGFGDQVVLRADLPPGKYLAAPTFAEIAVKLPIKYGVRKSSNDGNEYYYGHDDYNFDNLGEEETVVNACAKIWLYLKAEGLIK